MYYKTDLKMLKIIDQTGLKLVPGQAPKLQRDPVSKNQNKKLLKIGGIFLKLPPLIHF